MTSPDPTYLSQGVNYLGFLAKELGDLRGKATLAHELIQNADDAKDESGNFSATNIAFDVRDDALVVTNDAVFREMDFNRIRDLAGGSKRSEAGERTTGAFGVGFISVYQVTDRPEIHSAGRRWTLIPDNPEKERIEVLADPSLTPSRGTLFRLPWALYDSQVRQELKVPTIDRSYVESFLEDLRHSLPKAVLFLKKLDKIELLRNGNLMERVARIVDGHDTLIAFGDDSKLWRVIEGDFSPAASNLKERFRLLAKDNRSTRIQIAIPDSVMTDGLLFATLPTERSTRLPFHIDADFFPDSDRKSIVFGDSDDPRSEWNRAAIRAAASVFRDNLIEIRDMFATDVSAFWATLERLYSIQRDSSADPRMALESFWEVLAPEISDSPIVYSESGKWVKPGHSWVPTGEREEKAVPAFEALGFEIVHRELWKYRNLLTGSSRTGNGVGARTLSPRVIHHALKGKTMVARPCPVPAFLQPREILDLLWEGIHGALDNAHRTVRLESENLLRECSLAPGLDGQLWPCGSTYIADEQTRALFAPLLPKNMSLLAEQSVPLLWQLCPKFTPQEAIDILEEMDPEDLEASWRSGDFDPAQLIHWFNEKKSSLTDDTRDRLAEAPIFPSSKRLHRLRDLWLPGGFENPASVDDLLETKAIKGLTDFITQLGARELTFEQYAIRYIPQAFSDNSTESIEVKEKHLGNLERRIGEIKTNQKLREDLAKSNIVECLDGQFRKPGQVYFLSDEVKAVLGDSVDYANLPDDSETRRDLYGWLGVETRLRVRDLVQLVGLQASKPPTESTVAIVVRALEIFGKMWVDLNAGKKALIGSLREIEWLPAEGDATKWYKPNELYAAFNKHLFGSQAKFIDVPVPVQQRISDCLEFLQVKLRPEASLVVGELMRCVELDREPPRGIYSWLNGNAHASDILPLRETKCLMVAGRYLRPAEVFWGSHPFGSFRVQLGPDFRSFLSLLTSLGIKEAPDYSDSIEVLKDVSAETGDRPLSASERDVVLNCWVNLSDALEKGDIAPNALAQILSDVSCVPNDVGRLNIPSRMFFEDRPSLAERFPSQLKGNCITRTERVWTAMEGAGVRYLSSVVHGHLIDPVNPIEDHQVTERIMQRSSLIATILEGVTRSGAPETAEIPLSQLRFFRADELSVAWELRDFGGTWAAAALEPAQAHLEILEKAIYFTAQRDGLHPWSSIARELAFAVAPNEPIASVAPGLRTVLEVPTLQDAVNQAQELGIVPVQELGPLSGRGEVSHSFEEGPEGESSEERSWDRRDDSAKGGRPHSDGATHDAVDEPFAKRLYEVQTITTPRAGRRRVFLPPAGPKTQESARVDTVESIREGRARTEVSRSITRWEPAEAENELADKFKALVHGDYGKRCQICSKSFDMRGGQLQVYVVHVVPPSWDHRTNHLGDLMGLCGWHYSIIRYGNWAFLNPNTAAPFEDTDASEGWREMRDFLSGAPQLEDEEGNSYVSLKIRFWNVYQEWGSDPITVDEEIRYSVPHWIYLCELLLT